MSNDIISITEQSIRKYRIRKAPSLSFIEHHTFVGKDDIDRFRVLLDRGFEVTHHDRSGKVQKAILSFHGPSSSLILKPIKSTFLKLFRVDPLVSLVFHFSCSLFVMSFFHFFP
jgi:hypothetical protein